MAYSTSRNPFREVTNGISGEFEENSGNKYMKFPLSESWHALSATQDSSAKGSVKRDTKNRKATLTESPRSKQVYRDFLKNFKEKEKQGFSHTFQATCRRLTTLPDKLHWKIFLELADLAKRENKLQEARALFSLASWLQPYAQQTWLEYSKLEEESGFLQKSRMLLLLGLHFSTLSDQLAIKSLKTEEKLRDLTTARSLLGNLRFYSLEKTWKALLEGALMEARAGNIEVCRNWLKYLVNTCPHYGAIYLEAIKVEEKYANDLHSALDYCEKGIARNGRYGPLWFSYLKALEKAEASKLLSIPEIQRKVESMLSQAPAMLSKELVWKLYLDYALYSERMGRSKICRNYLKEAALCVPENLRWKLWLAGSRVELKCDNTDGAFKLINRALQEVPTKQKSSVLIELSRMQEYLGNVDSARETIMSACDIAKQDWKIYLESITFDMRQSEFQRGLDVATMSLSLYPATGRLWAALIQLQHTNVEMIDNEIPFKSFLLALQEVPKSGEVWCEGARLKMNPFTPHYDLDKAEEFLKYAIQFTPQYGDSFIELLRLYLLTGQFEKIGGLKRQCVNADPNYGMLWFYCKRNALETAHDVWKRAKKLLLEELSVMKGVYSCGENKESWKGFMWSGLMAVNQAYTTHKAQLTKAQQWRLIFGTEALPV